MNVGCYINPKLLYDYDFNHRLSYRLLIYIMAHVNADSHRVILHTSFMLHKLNTNRHTYNKALNELIANRIIIVYNYNEFEYVVNKRIFMEFKAEI